MRDLSQREVKKTMELNERLKRRLSSLKDESQAAVQAGIRTGATMGTAFGVAYIEQRYPDKNTVFGVDLSLLLGVAGTAAGAFGWAGRDKQTNDLVEAAGLGGLAAFASKKGGEMGAQALADAT